MKQVKGNIYLLESAGFVNIYAIVRDSGVLIIDTGTPGKAETIIKELAGINVKPSDIKAIVITHAHPDHAGSCAALSDKSPAKIYVHRNDFDILLGKAPLPEPRYFVEKLSSFITKHFWKYTPPKHAIPVDEHSAIQDFGDFRIIHTPGHTPGSISILDAKDGTLFCGDVINNRGNSLTGPLKYFTIDAGQAWHSVEKLGVLNFNTLCPGHGTWIPENAQQKIQDLLANKRIGND